jgi:hypothetical protein
MRLAGLAGRLDTETRRGGLARLLLGFIIGALFSAVPMYYFHGGRDALQPRADEALAMQPQPDPGSVEPVNTRFNAKAKPFASRLTYELSHAPAEPPVAPLKVAASAVAPAPARPAMAEASPQAERVANARPISAVPPEPRDRTGEIEKEAQKPEYREASRPPPKGAPAPASRVFEGRAVELKPPPKTPSAAIAAKENATPRAEADDRVAGVTPIKPPAAKPVERSVVAKAPVTVTPAAERDVSGSRAGSSSESGIESKLEATRGWLAASPPTTHTIQLMGAGSDEQLEAQLKALGRIIEPGKLHVFRTKAQGKPSITVVYGAYVDRRSAQQALEKLPATLVANKPVLRTVNGIRAEMKQHKTDG